MSGSSYHVPVLLKEAVDGLRIKPEGTYVDCTLGGGGHAREILSHLNDQGRLIAFDQDADAAAQAPEDPRVVFIPHNFRHLKRFLRLHQIDRVDGVLADLGVSSHQFDEAGRGFSTRFDAEMDMRMDRRQDKTAHTVLSTYTEQQLHKMFERYGEVTNAKTLARTIVAVRANQSLRTIDNFKQALQSVVKGNPNRYFAQVFQALRIEVNDELGALQDLLLQLPDVLKPGGRVAIITFHSLEDRMVKNFFKKGSFEEEALHPFEQKTITPPFNVITKKPVVPSQEELRNNPRSRSAKLRIAERMD